MAMTTLFGNINALIDIHVVFNTIISYIPTFQILLIGEKKIRTLTGKGDLNEKNRLEPEEKGFLSKREYKRKAAIFLIKHYIKKKRKYLRIVL